MVAKTTAPTRDFRYEISGVVLTAAGLILLISAVGIDAGVITEALTRWLRALVGQGVFVAPLALIFFGVRLLIGRESAGGGTLAWGLSLLYLVFLAAVHMRADPMFAKDPMVQQEHGGIVGWALATLLVRAVGNTGAVIALVAATLSSLLLVAEMAPSEAGRWIVRLIALCATGIGAFISWVGAGIRKGKRKPPRRRPRPKPKEAAPVKAEDSALEDEPPAPQEAGPEPEKAGTSSDTTPVHVVRAESHHPRPSRMGTLTLFDDSPPLPE